MCVHPPVVRVRVRVCLVQAAFLTNELPLTAVSSWENGLNPAADPSPGSLCTLRKVMGGVFK